MTPIVNEVGHGIRAAFYANRPDGQWAIMECLCGQDFTGQTDSWEDAGAEMDAHLDQKKAEREFYEHQRDQS